MKKKKDFQNFLQKTISFGKPHFKQKNQIDVSLISVVCMRKMERVKK